MLYRIGHFSKLAKVTVKALRYYDEVGLLKPECVDRETSYRMYTTAQLIPLQRIAALRQAGLSMEEIAAILSGQDGSAILEQRRIALRHALGEAQGRLSHLESILRQEDFFMNYQAAIRDIPSYTVFYKEGILPTYGDLMTFAPQAGKECAAANPDLKCVQPGYCFVTYVDHEYKEKDVGLFYAEAVEKRGKETETIRFMEIPAVQAACVYHKGPYEGLRDAYAFAMNWIEENGYQVVDRARECYIDGCWNKNDSANWLTELQFPIKYIK